MGKINTSEMTQEQRQWFAQAIASMVCVDGHLDSNEQVYLKHAISFLKDKKEIATLLHQVKTQNISELWSIRFSPQQAFNILKYLAGLTISDGNLSSLEVDYFQHISRLLGVSDQISEKVLNEVAQKVDRSKEATPAATTGLADIDPDNSSLLRYPIDCFICGKQDFFLWGLRPDCMEIQTNVLGVPTYGTALSGQTFCDYNLSRITVCPQCHFSSDDQAWFRSDPDQTLPFAPDVFTKEWENIADSLPDHPSEKFRDLLCSSRTPEEAIVAYDLAIATHTLLEEITSNPKQSFKVAELRLIQAEILMQIQLNETAQTQVKRVESALTTILDKLSPPFQKEAEQYLRLIQLYFKDSNGPTQYEGFYIKK